MQQEHNNMIDLLKGIAIIAVVLYHVGILESGYLGVDVFFVIAGFLAVRSIYKRLKDNTFSFWSYIKNKVIRLLPLVLIASVVCLIIGFIFWLPDDYENLSESIIASILFSNNILSGITTNNYWNAINDFKPLMHMWYLGILMEFYVIAPLLMELFKKLAIKTKRSVKKLIGEGIGLLSIISLILFILPMFNAGSKFYFLQFRFFELGLGGLVGLFSVEINDFKYVKRKGLFWVSFALLIVTICIGVFTFDISKIGVEASVVGSGKAAGSTLLMPNEVLVVITVILTAFIMTFSGKVDSIGKNNILILIGRRSYSIFVWHQVLLALYRYSVSSDVTVVFIVLYLAAVIVVSEISFRFIEETIVSSRRALITTIVSATIICGISIMIYLNAGVVRDVPELGVSKENAHRNMHAEYCDRIYEYDTDFGENGKLNVLVIGNSYARDFGNIILESGYDVNLSYISSLDESYTNRIKKADKIFIFSEKKQVPDYIWDNCDDVYGIGTKSFGICNGNIYSGRFDDDYFLQTINLDEGYDKLNTDWQKDWGDNYINMIKPIITTDGKVRVFTDENMFISQDCKHLTQGGAKYYVKLLNLKKILNQ